MVDDGHGAAVVRVQPLLQRLNIVIGSTAAGGSAGQTPIDTHLGAAASGAGQLAVLDQKTPLGTTCSGRYRWHRICRKLGIVR